MGSITRTVFAGKPGAVGLTVLFFVKAEFATTTSVIALFDDIATLPPVKRAGADRVREIATSPFHVDNTGRRGKGDTART